MTLSLKEFGRLKACMARTTSDSDPEALASIRAANAILVAHALTWEKVFARTVTVVSEMSGEVVTDEGGDDLDHVFEMALDGASGSFREMLLDIQAKHERGIPLTPRQMEVVREAADRSTDRRPTGRFR